MTGIKPIPLRVVINAPFGAARTFVDAWPSVIYLPPTRRLGVELQATTTGVRAPRVEHPYHAVPKPSVGFPSNRPVLIVPVYLPRCEARRTHAPQRHTQKKTVHHTAFALLDFNLDTSIHQRTSYGVTVRVSIRNGYCICFRHAQSSCSVGAGRQPVASVHGSVHDVDTDIP